MQNRQRLPLKKGRENKSMLNLSIPGIFTLKGKKKTRGGVWGNTAWFKKENKITEKKKTQKTEKYPKTNYTY